MLSVSFAVPDEKVKDRIYSFSSTYKPAKSKMVDFYQNTKLMTPECRNRRQNKRN